MPFDDRALTVSRFLVSREDLARSCWQESAATDHEELAPGQVLLAVSKFAFTANNVTYARLGSELAYWEFFRAPEGFGCIPVWGLGTVVRSRHAEIAEGEEVYGFMPMASHVVLQPQAPLAARFIEGSPHRRNLAATYNEYVLIDRAADYERKHEEAHLVLRPLFSLSFFSAEYLKESGLFDARQILVSSASSKASLGLAYDLVLARAERPIEIIGLTSTGNLAFAAARGVYDRVVSYDSIDTIPARDAVFVDIAGNNELRTAIHLRWRDRLKKSVLAGLTHEGTMWRSMNPHDAELPGPVPEIFFTPHHILRLRKEWGAELLRARLSAAWRGFLEFVEPWLRYEHGAGRQAVERAYREVLDGRTAPDRAHILSLERP